MSYNVLASKEFFIEFIKHIRKSMKDKDKKNIYSIEELFIDHRTDIYFNKEFLRRMSVFKFDDGFKIELSDDELTAAAIILFYEIDLMQENNEVEIKKESKENIWHFNPDLAEYLPNGKIKRLQTMINHFKEEGLKIYEETHSSLNVVKYLMNKCSYKEQMLLTRYHYEFDNGTGFELLKSDIEAIVKVLTDDIIV